MTDDEAWSNDFSPELLDRSYKGTRMKGGSTGFAKTHDYEEKLRRLQCLDEATYEMELCEQAFKIMGDDGPLPFEGWSHDGEINVIYDRNGRVDHVTVIDDNKAA